ncbi:MULTISPECIES: cell division protein FtsL [Deefgea]|uniref:Cell division protein FtsL n=2 Tax=Deefgea TaxID=400947 RepID=A0A6M8SQT1_9NEIS|nr:MULTISPECIES: cell division protein FtsL [Deefgea]MBM5574532.1 cell division protein FtsL [Deefgea sp. CFH1-16]MCB5196818.1 cell division protein FtsL [Deefgea salmonis]QKJ66484.1 cell division protein FtsL [Deefgea piscis]
MTRLNMFLLAVLVICALAVITSRHKSRKLFIELQKEDVLTRKLDVEWGQLQLEQSTWAMHSRIEQEAGHNLEMQVAPSNRTQVILEHGELVKQPEVKDL